MKRDPSNLIIQFAKWPTPGKVKTRLAKKLGETLAVDSHIQLVQATNEKLNGLSFSDYQLWLDAVGPTLTTRGGLFDQVLRGELSVSIQQGRDLGERMAFAIQQGLSRYDKVVVVGSDCPELDEQYLAEAFASLASRQVVLGPAEDGGYVLIGFSAFHTRVFDNVDWGSGRVLSQTLKNLDECGLSSRQLDCRWDVDELEDYIRWQSLQN